MNELYTDTGKDEIIEEIRKIKYKIAEEHGFSVAKLVAYLKEKEKSNRMVVSSRIPLAETE